MEGIITRGGGEISTDSGYGSALIRVTTKAGNVVTCTNGTSTYTRTCGTQKYVEFYVDYGTWTVSSGKDSASVEVTELRIYTTEINMGIGTTFGIKIDTTNGDPNGAVTYTDDAVGFTPLQVNLSTGVCNYGSWGEKDFMEDFLGCRPCVLKNGAVNYYLNPNDYTKKLDGSAADITSGNDGDVMVEFKKTYYKFSKVGTDIYFQISSDSSKKDNDGYVTTAFTSEDDGHDVDYMYYGAYEGYNLSNKIRSISGKDPTRNITFANFHTYCKNNGTGYEMECFAKRWYILGLLILVTKARDIQAAIGYGKCGITSSSDSAGYKPNNNGVLNTNGLFYGRDKDSNNRCPYSVKCFGIENMWGNMWEFINGLCTLSGSALGIKGTAPYNDSGSGYTSVTDGYTRNSGLFITNKIPVLNGASMIASAGQTDSNIGFCDYLHIVDSSDCISYVGGSWSNNWSSNGPFCCYIGNGPSYCMGFIGARILYA